MGNAIFRGLIGVSIGASIILLDSINHANSWTFQEVMFAVCMASFLGPFGTALASKSSGTENVNRVQTES